MLTDLALFTILVAVMVCWARLAAWLIGRPEHGQHHRGRQSDRDSRQYSSERPRPPRPTWAQLYAQAEATDQLLTYAAFLISTLPAA